LVRKNPAAFTARSSGVGAVQRLARQRLTSRYQVGLALRSGPGGGFEPTNSAQVFDLLVNQRGWVLPRYQRWLARKWEALLVGD